MSEPAHEQDTPSSFRTCYQEVSARRSAARTQEREKVDRMGLWEAFKYRCGRAGYRSFTMMLTILLFTTGWTVLCALGLIREEFRWELVAGLLLCPVAFVVFLRGWSYDRWGMLTLGWAITLLGIGVPWWINGMVMG